MTYDFITSKTWLPEVGIYSNASFCLRANAPLNNRSQSSNILTEFDNIEKKVGQNLEPKQKKTTV
jgi:hypothetical protein